MKQYPALKFSGILILFFLFSTVGWAQTKKPKVKTYGSSLFVEAKGQSKEELSQKTMDWLEATLDKTAFSPRTMDVEEGYFFGIGSYVDSVGIAEFGLGISVKKNGVQMMFDANFHKQNYRTNARLNDNRLRRKTQQYFQELAKDLDQYLNKTGG